MTTHGVKVKESSAIRLGCVMTLSVGLAASDQRTHLEEKGARRTAAAIDSAHLARVALDSTNRASHFVSEVLRYELHGDSVRIVTMPDHRKNPILDGMAIIWLRRDGRILRLTWTDSA